MECVRNTLPLIIGVRGEPLKLNYYLVEEKHLLNFTKELDLKGIKNSEKIEFRLIRREAELCFISELSSSIMGIWIVIFKKVYSGLERNVSS